MLCKVAILNWVRCNFRDLGDTFLYNGWLALCVHFLLLLGAMFGLVWFFFSQRKIAFSVLIEQYLYSILVSL